MTLRNELWTRISRYSTREEEIQGQGEECTIIDIQDSSNTIYGLSIHVARFLPCNIISYIFAIRLPITTCYKHIHSRNTTHSLDEQSINLVWADSSGILWTYQAILIVSSGCKPGDLIMLVAAVLCVQERKGKAESERTRGWTMLREGSKRLKRHDYVPAI